MEYCGSTKREPEQSKDFAARATRSINQLRLQHDALMTLHGRGSVTTGVIEDAMTLLQEAIDRGLKGKEPKP